MDSASLFMSCSSASVAPSGRHLAIKLSPTRSRARICSAQLGSAVIAKLLAGSGFDGDVEVADVEVVLGSQLRLVQPELLGGVSVGPMCARPVGHLPLAHVLLDGPGELEVEPVVDAPQLAHRVG